MSTTVKISCGFCGRHEVQALFSAGGLAVTPYHGYECKSSDSRFVVTHVDSGLKIGDPVSLERATRALMRLLEVTDWQRRNLVDDAQRKNRAWVKQAKVIAETLLQDDESL